MSDTPGPESGSLVPAPERSLAHPGGGLASRGLTLAAELLARPVLAGPPGEISCLRGHTDCVLSVAFSPDERFALSGSWDRTLRVWELATGREVRRLEGHEHRVSSVAFSPDGRLALSGSWDGTARVWHWERGSEVARFGEARSGMVQCVACSPDGRHAAWGGSQASFGLCDVLACREIRRFAVPAGPVRTLKFSLDGSRLVSGSGHVDLSGQGRDQGAVCLWNVQTGARLWGWVDAKEPVLSVDLSADGRFGFSSTGSPARSRLNITRVWEVESGDEIARYEAHRQPVFSGAFFPDARHLLLGSRDRTLRLWDTGAGAELHRFEGHEDAVYSVAVSPDGRLALSGSGDGTVRLWRLPPIASLDAQDR